MEINCLVDEIRKYCTLTKLLQKSLQDTRKTFRDINEAKCVIESESTILIRRLYGKWDPAFSLRRDVAIHAIVGLGLR